MKNPIRIAAATAAAVLTVLTVGTVAPATAAGHHEGSGDLGTHSRGPVTSKMLALSLIKVADTTLVRISKSRQISSLSPENMSRVLNNIRADRAALAKMAKLVKKTHKPATIKKVQKSLKKFHAENYADSAYLLDRSEDIVWAVSQVRENLAADDSFSPEERASLNAQIDAVEARVMSSVAKAQGLTARSAVTEVNSVQDALYKAEDDLEDIDTTIYNGGDSA